jgi:hypothetical protein
VIIPDFVAADVRCTLGMLIMLRPSKHRFWWEYIILITTLERLRVILGVAYVA